MEKQMYDDEQQLKVTFNRETLPQYLLQAQFAELVELKKIIHEWSSKHNKELMKILDIGIGDSRILTHLCGIEEMRSVIGSYLWIDVAQNCVDISTKQIQELWCGGKATAVLHDAQEISKLNWKFDLIVTTWFTAGNFYPNEYDPKTSTPWKLDLSQHPKFTNIFQQAYNKLNDWWEIIIWSMYIDNEPTRIKQEAAYEYFGRDVVTDERDCFTATANGRRSQRFTKERVYSYLSFVPKNCIEFISLDTYE
jgi:hypothetical protein